ncbi:MAG: GrpB family protein [Anaerobacillus sp.]|uniref:GrpB family protein n=1 Tax=Anaerobacillus sp. TaxID=1872506 RepID=UPI00391DBEBD
MDEIVTFSNEKLFRDKAKIVVCKHKEKINKVLPDAEVLHVGSTAVEGSLTKGDVDLQVRVSQSKFEHAKVILKELYKINEGSDQTSYFCAFEKHDEILPLGIQLTAISSELDHFWKLAKFFREYPEYLARYNQIKESNNGKYMDKYREEKSIFIGNIFSSEIFHEFLKKI